MQSQSESPGMIRYRIVIHGFIDGFSRLVTGIRASDNNRAQTVLDLFHQATEGHGIPSRVRGDHGTENLLVAGFMDDNFGPERGSYIWGRCLLLLLFLLSISQSVGVFIIFALNVSGEMSHVASERSGRNFSRLSRSTLV
jgi:hypothetical protein